MTTQASASLSPADAFAEPGAPAIPLGLAGLSRAIAAMGGLTVTIDGVPDAARLSAGQFLGDGSWSVGPADLDGLALHPSPGRNRNCRLSIHLRRIDKDMGDAFSIGTVYIDVDGDAGRATIAGSDGAISLRREGTAGERQPAEKPARRIVKVTRANPAPSATPPTSGASPTDDGDDGKGDEQSPSVTAPPDRPESPFQAIATRQPGEPGIASTAVLDEQGQPPITMPKPTPAHVAPVQVDEAGIVAVRVTPGLRIGKFGKTGRPEEVVSVRGRSAQASRPDESGSIVFVRQRQGESPSA